MRAVKGLPYIVPLFTWTKDEELTGFALFSLWPCDSDLFVEGDIYVGQLCQEK